MRIEADYSTIEPDAVMKKNRNEKQLSGIIYILLAILLGGLILYLMVSFDSGVSGSKLKADPPEGGFNVSRSKVLMHRIQINGVLLKYYFNLFFLIIALLLFTTGMMLYRKNGSVRLLLPFVPLYFLIKTLFLNTLEQMQLSSSSLNSFVVTYFWVSILFSVPLFIKSVQYFEIELINWKKGSKLLIWVLLFAALIAIDFKLNRIQSNYDLHALEIKRFREHRLSTIRPGQTELDVLKRLGPPLKTEYRVAIIRYHYRLSTGSDPEWLILHFKAGQLTTIERTTQ